MRNFEPFIQQHLSVFLQQWDAMAATGAKSDGFANVEARVWLK
jgi:hypothetical protein